MGGMHADTEYDMAMRTMAAKTIDMWAWIRGRKYRSTEEQRRSKDNQGPGRPAAGISGRVSKGGALQREPLLPHSAITTITHPLARVAATAA